MNKVECIIVEDERPAQEILKSFLSRVEWLELKGVYSDAVSALEYLQQHEPDLVFLDIQMPVISGIELLKLTRNMPQVIITTAYSDYAIDAFELEVRDYLIKPFSFERFLKAVSRITVKPDPKLIHQLNHADVSHQGFAFFNVNKTMIKVMFDEILYVESMREYVYIHTPGGKVITKMGIGEMERILGDGFLRIHRCFLVNWSKVSSFNAEEVFVNKISLAIGPNYKKMIEAAFAKVSIRG